MYITVKDTERIREQLTYVNTIDALFSNDNLDTVMLNDQDEIVPVIRTKTFVTDNPTHRGLNIYSMKNLLETIEYLIDKHPEPEKEYYSFKIPKKTKGFRQINAPTTELKKDMKRIASILEKNMMILSHDSAWAYVPGRDVVKAMQEHTNNESKWFLKIDLKDFFGSCNPDFIYKQLNKIYPFAHFKSDHQDRTLKKLAKFATLDNGLPQGTPLSPILTNLIMVEWDYKINRLLADLIKNGAISKQRYVYTRYADDIIISAKRKFDPAFITAVIQNMIREEEYPFTINMDKLRFGSNAGRNWNLGVMCNKENKTTVGHRKKHDIKNYLFNYINNVETYSLEDLRWLLGQLSWLRNVEPDYFEGLMIYYRTKFNIDIWPDIIEHIKKLTNN